MGPFPDREAPEGTTALRAHRGCQAHRACHARRPVLSHPCRTRDLCFEFERLLLDQLGSSVTVADEVVGFRYFDSRDLLGFVDGTANPTGHDIGASTLVGSEDQAFAGGSLVVQKHLHQMQPWARLAKDEQERIIGREIVSMSNCPTRRAARNRTRPSPRSWTTTAPSTTSCATTCPSAAPARANMAPTSSATQASVGDAEDAGAHVPRRSARHARPPARFLDGAHRRRVLRSRTAHAERTRGGGA